ncbi:M48 family metallopeptidase [Shewanella gelidii]|uniref:Peptidase M48 domain-containing protein n=1 Tax=Shewanella gelidii TaxID=1642821 RepID=A0A917JKH6_9GAMM|nr:M48 family metallopeptidase [Shewanella gelidii]MCL1097381.1 M48 family metallopeptidase [Shewanella gelidii]GGI74751.1 hypothetical protein GCM10009332_10210 [Shewanella gelidii]
MEYQPGLPEHNDNISHKHPLMEFALLLGGLSVVAFVVYLLLGLAVDLVAEHISPEQELQWFKRNSVDVIASSMLDHGGEAKRIDSALFQGLKQCLDVDYPLQLWLVKSEKVNALAVPGDDVFVYQGLVDAVQSENGLAFVLAHEIAHFQQRDHLKGIGRGLILASLMAVVGMGDAAALANPAAALSQAQYSQSRESSADAKALQALACHYGHVGGATELFDALLKQEGKFAEFGHYFATHPKTQARIEQIHTWAQSRGYGFKETNPLSTFDGI